MTMKKISTAVLLFVGLVFGVQGAMAAKAVFAGGCFWCMEADFEKLAGVTDVISGFTGGTVANPTYSGNHEGHYEAVEVTYDPDEVSYAELLDYYWVHVDPFDAGGQFCDRGPSYRTAIFVANDEEKRLADESKKKVAAQFPDKEIATPVLQASAFYPVQGRESYHQDYYKKNPIRYKFYRWNCGRDQRLESIWGDRASH
jgi:peptide-methionine (S)-S-oxide reductase